ncbi:PEP-CTERM/exosortase system-associated acyltransferase [Halomonas salinarum]|uniref:PEP-CTERM/exosortase system-associated acyltransferase n=1 Tax=Halomonas salinarum TaxID=1158993 RepID=UPI00143997F9|nr:PEP-CTERM/exosortase system-associated acyltransferase [Halomonas salinarum]
MDIYEEFNNNFSVRIAFTELEKRRAYALRHRVFREELKYELGIDKESYLEFDNHDSNSVLCIIIHNDTGITAGCLRLVKICENGDKKNQMLPIEKICADNLSIVSLHPKNHSRNSVCEISRLAVPKEFRKAKYIEESDSSYGKKALRVHQQHGHLLQIIGISLFLSATAIVGISGRRHVYAMMERRFARLLGMSGISFQLAGTAVHYHGERSPFYIDQHEAERSMKPQLKRLYTSIKEDLANQYYLQEKIDIESPYDATTY